MKSKTLFTPDLSLASFWTIGLFSALGLILLGLIIFGTDAHIIAQFHDAASGVAAYTTPAETPSAVSSLRK